MDGVEKNVKFEFELLPNDMKYLAFIEGESVSQHPIFLHLQMLIKLVVMI